MHRGVVSDRVAVRGADQADSEAVVAVAAEVGAVLEVFVCTEVIADRFEICLLVTMPEKWRGEAVEASEARGADEDGGVAVEAAVGVAVDLTEAPTGITRRPAEDLQGIDAVTAVRAATAVREVITDPRRFLHNRFSTRFQTIIPNLLKAESL